MHGYALIWSNFKVHIMSKIGDIFIGALSLSHVGMGAQYAQEQAINIV